MNTPPVFSPVASIILLCSCLGGALAATENDLQQAVNPAGQRPSPLQFTMVAERSQIRPCEPVVLHLAVKNVSQETISFMTQNWGLESNCVFAVASKENKSVGSTAFGKRKAESAHYGNLQSVRLPPGQDFSGEVLINRLFDMTLSDEYVITGEWTPLDFTGKLPATPLSAMVRVVVTDGTYQGETLLSPAQTTDSKAAPSPGADNLKSALEFAMTTEKELVGPCEPILLRLAVRNVSQNPVPLGNEGLENECRFVVTSKTASSVDATTFAKRKALYPRVGSGWNVALDPGQTITANVLINRLYDMTVSGEYTIAAEWSPIDSTGMHSTAPLSATVRVVVTEGTYQGETLLSPAQAADSKAAPSPGAEAVTPATDRGVEEGTR